MQLGHTLAGIARRVPFYEEMRRKYDLGRLRRKIVSSSPLNVVIGGGQTSYEGWIFTDRDQLDITNPRDWANLFAPHSIDRLLCEHVLEHLEEAECRVVMAEAYRHLRPGGLFRIAVPDGYRRDHEYVAEVSPPRDGHKLLLNVDTLTSLVGSAGFSARPLEYFDQHDLFHAVAWDETEGFVARSARFNRDQPFQRDGVYFTSLIVDANKPT